MPRLLSISLFVAAGSLVACSWQHAPGHAQREAMTKQQLPRIVGTHGFSTPEGDIRVSDVDVTPGSGVFARTATRTFNVDYRNARAKCVAPEKDAQVALTCTITVGSESEPTWTANVGPGCIEGAISEVKPGETAQKRYAVRTDMLRVAGTVRPSREVSLLDDHGVVAFSDSPGGDLVLFTRHDTKLGVPELITLVAVQTYAWTMADGQCASGT